MAVHSASLSKECPSCIFPSEEPSGYRKAMEVMVFMHRTHNLSEIHFDNLSCLIPSDWSQKLICRHTMSEMYLEEEYLCCALLLLFIEGSHDYCIDVWNVVYIISSERTVTQATLHYWIHPWYSVLNYYNITFKMPIKSKLFIFSYFRCGWSRWNLWTSSCAVSSLFFLPLVMKNTKHNYK